MCTDEEEQRLSERICEEILAPGTLFTDQNCRMWAMDEYLARYDEDTPWDQMRDFHVSPGFVSDFKSRNRFTSRRGHFNRRPNVDPERCRVWQHEIDDLLATVDHDLIFNETLWCLYPRGVLAWAPTGADNGVIGIGGDEKECLTVMATCQASGKRDSLYILAHANPARAERTQLSEVGRHRRDHYASGCMARDTFDR
jgi:hypothetical protein